MKTRWTLAVTVLTVAFASAQQTWICRNGECPWHDRMDRYVIGDLPAEYASDITVPQQACNSPRQLLLPREGIPRVLIALCSVDAAVFAEKLKLTPTGKTLQLYNAAGTKALMSYVIFAYNTPPKVTNFPGAKAGVMLLSLSATPPLPDSSTSTTTSTHIMPKEQEFAAQEWPFEPGPRTVKMHVETPPQGINSNTGIMLCLHNWGGRYDQSTYVQWCINFAKRYNVIAISVNYLQSGGGEPKIVGEKPYDHGYLQAMDCLRALYHVQKRLRDAGTAFNPRRCYSMGGSGGGNVSLMVNKFAPATFACVVDICGMPGLTDGIAYGTKEYGSSLNAGYVRDADSPAFLSTDMQEIRNPGNLAHLKRQYTVNPANKIVIVHGLDDHSCPVVHKVEIFKNMIHTGFRPDGHFLSAKDIGKHGVTTTGHAVGDRQKITEAFADCYMLADGPLALAAPGPTDFEKAERVVYATTNGRFVIDYSQGPPTIAFNAD